MRAQIQTAVGMILTLVIVAAVLTLGVWGIIAIFDTFGDVDYDRTFDALDDATASHRSFGSRTALTGAPPEPFCVFNTTASDKTCVKDYSGYELCRAQMGYWDAAGPQDGNVVFESARNERIDRLAPKNGRYACFGTSDRYVFVEGHGSYIKVSPMREIESFRLEHNTNPDAASVVLSFFTSSLEGDDPELAYVDASAGALPGWYGRSSMSVSLGDASISSLRVQLDGAFGETDGVEANGNPIEQELGVRVPQLES